MDGVMADRLFVAFDSLHSTPQTGHLLERICVQSDAKTYMYCHCNCSHHIVSRKRRLYALRRVTDVGERVLSFMIRLLLQPLLM